MTTVIVPQAAQTNVFEQIYEHLKLIRASKTCQLKPTKMLREEIVGIDGTTQPLRLRYYQVQGIYHLLRVNRMILGDGTGLGKTLQAIAALCYIWDRDSTMKVMVVCPKSAIGQWASEIDKFSIGIKYFIASGTLDQRKEAYLAWSQHSGPGVLVVNYHGLVRDWDQGITKEPPPEGAKKGTQAVAGLGFLDKLTSNIQRLTVIFDEITACKNPTTKTHQTCKFLSVRAKRVWGLTATLLQNHLMEGFGIYKVIRPETFGTKNAFLNVYCNTENKHVSNAVIKIVVGYKNLQHFRQTIDPFFYGRAKQDVSTELPALTTREVVCELSKVEDLKYAEALSGILELGDGELRDYKDTRQLTSLIYIQEIL